MKRERRRRVFGRRLWSAVPLLLDCDFGYSWDLTSMRRRQWPLLIRLRLQKVGCRLIDFRLLMGKTLLWNTINTTPRSDAPIVLAIASLRVTSFLFPRGQTCHSCFKLPIQISSITQCSMYKVPQMRFCLIKLAWSCGMKLQWSTVTVLKLLTEFSEIYLQHMIVQGHSSL